MNVRNVLVFAIASVALGLPTISMAQSRPDRPVDATVRPRRPPPPALLIKGPDGKHKPIELRKVSADVRVLGHIAQTSLTMTFFNPHGRALEGDLYVPLPEGSTVSGYALDVNGTLVDGVVVTCLLYTSPSPRDGLLSRMPSSA